MPSKEKITICIPTKNRSDFLARLLHYFADTKYRHWIFIGDSSNEFHIDETKRTIQSLKGKLNVKHFECPGMGPNGAINHIIQFITTSYCAATADDDFLCVSGINRCVDFLERNPDYGAAHGTGIVTSIDRSGPYGNIVRVNYYPQATLNADSGSQRLHDYFAAGPLALAFSVHHTQDWRDMLQGFVSMQGMQVNSITDELIISSISAIRNKVKELNCLYLIRFSHEGIKGQPAPYDWVTSPDWYQGFTILHDRAIDELIKQDGISKEEAEEVFKQVFWAYLSRMFSRGQPSHSLLIKIVKQIPGLVSAYIKIRSHFQAKKEINLLHILLKPNSPHHEDFMPIYRAITKTITENHNQEE